MIKLHDQPKKACRWPRYP